MEHDELALAADPVAYTSHALAMSKAWLAEGVAADELRQAMAIAASMEAYVAQLDDAKDAEHNAAEMKSRIQAAIAKLERAEVRPKGKPSKSSGAEDLPAARDGRAGQRDKALAEASLEQLDQAIEDVRAEGKSPTPGAVARKLKPRTLTGDQGALFATRRDAGESLAALAAEACLSASALQRAMAQHRANSGGLSPKAIQSAREFNGGNLAGNVATIVRGRYNQRRRAGSELT